MNLSNYEILSPKLDVGNPELSGLYILLCGGPKFCLPHLVNFHSVKKQLLQLALNDAKFELINSCQNKGRLSRDSSSHENSFFDLDRIGYDDEFYFFKTQYIKDKKLKSPILFKIQEKRREYELSCASSNFEELNKFSTFIEKEFLAVKNYDDETNFGVLICQDGQTYIRETKIEDKVSQRLNLELNYGKKFTDAHNKITEKLKENSNGLFLLHGTSGTGKTTYIKYLARKFGGEKMFIFIPTSFIDALVSPSILPILLERPNSVLVLEDAEKAVVSRESETGNESLVSSLLSIGDGILGSMLNISVILTFNTSREKIDKALLRKGRLHYEYKFAELEIEDAQNLVSTFNKNYIVKKPMTLAEIYNLEQDNNHKEEERARIGFGA